MWLYDYVLPFWSFAQQKAHPGKVTQSEEEATKDPVIRKSIKEAAAEVEKSEGRGQLKVTQHFWHQTLKTLISI